MTIVKSRCIRSSALIIVLVFGCRAQIDWRDHASFRTSRSDLSLAHVGPQEAVENAISRNLHYASIALDTVFFRNLPGLSGATVALGVEIYGPRPDGRPIKTVLDVQTASSGEAFLSFDNVALIEPFLYTGRNITISLHFKALAKNTAQHVRGRLAGAGDLVKKLNPSAAGALDLAGSLFDSVIGAFFGAGQEYKYTLTLYPADSVYRDKAEMLFTATRHVLISVPPPGAPPEYHGLIPSRIMPLLKLRGNRLVYKSSGEEYRSTPYIILNVTRFKRYPKEDTELRQVARRVDSAIEQGNYRYARENLPNLAIAINNDPVITQQEKDLERSWLEIRSARIAAREAESREKFESAIQERVKQVRYLVGVKKYFRQILEPFELKRIDYEVRTVARKAQDLGTEKNVPVPPTLAPLVEENRALDKRIAADEAEQRKALAAAASQKPKGRFAEIDPEGYFTYKPVYKRWWLWTTLLGVAGAAVGATYLLNPKETPEPKAVFP
jgi:hypothetical protein